MFVKENLKTSSKCLFHQDSRAQEAAKKISAFSFNLNVMICVGLRANYMSDGKCKHFQKKKTQNNREHRQAWCSSKMWILHLLFLSQQFTVSWSPLWWGAKLKHIAPSSLRFLQPPQAKAMHHAEPYWPSICFWRCYARNLPIPFRHHQYTKERCTMQFILSASNLYRWAVHKGTGLWSHLFPPCVSERLIGIRK